MSAHGSRNGRPTRQGVRGVPRLQFGWVFARLCCLQRTPQCAVDGARRGAQVMTTQRCARGIGCGCAGRGCPIEVSVWVCVWGFLEFVVVLPRHRIVATPGVSPQSAAMHINTDMSRRAVVPVITAQCLVMVLFFQTRAACCCVVCRFCIRTPAVPCGLMVLPPEWGGRAGTHQSVLRKLAIGRLASPDAITCSLRR